jgi:primosomal protein N' (replication factor Y)
VLRLAVPSRVAAVEAPPTDPAPAGEAPGPAGTGVAQGGEAPGPAAGTVAADPSGAVPVPAPVSGAALPAGPRRAPRPAARGPGDPLVELVARGRAGAVYWRTLPGEERGARVVALVEAALAAGRSAIVVAPEVVAGSAVLDAVRARFPDLADLSSDRSDRRRYRAWVQVRRGRSRVVVGGRSAVLAPVRGLGCIVVDDEANPAHKEQRTPRYHAREVALGRAARSRSLCVLTGAVPSAEAVAAIRAGACLLLQPDRAAERRTRPLVEVVDPDDEGPSAARLHPRGLAAMREALRRGESAFVLVPRRGAADPDAPGARTAGQVAAELARVLPGVPVWRLDREVVDPRAKPPWAGEGPGVVVGTVAGVKDTPPLPLCRTVVVVGADTALGQAEVRAPEEAYRTWTRAAAWCGPRESPGRLVLQARDGAHHAVQALVRADPVFFWRHELPRRQELGFPPARRLVLVEGPLLEEAGAARAALAAALGRGAELLGPAAMGRGWRIITKVRDVEAAALALRPVLAEASRSGGPRMSVDVEPLEVLAPLRAPAAT